MVEVRISMAKPLLGEEEKGAVLEVLDSGIIAQGPKVEKFEKKFAEFIGVKHAIATSNGTTALHVALLARSIGPGDEVITAPFTFIATANAIKMAGAKPVFVDTEENSFNIDPELIEKAITSRTRAIMPVHLYGRAAQMDKIIEIARKYNLLVIEDACQAHGTEFFGKKVGSFGDGCFSFYPTKNMAVGEGGMITTDDDEVAKKVRQLINHGSEKKYYHDSVGYNYRMTDIAAAIGIEQLKKLPSFNERRKSNARYLNKQLQGIKGLVPPEFIDGHVFHQYTIRITPEFPLSRDQVLEVLKEKGIGSAVFYPVPIHKQKAYTEYSSQYFPVAERLAQEVISLPVHPAVSEEDLKHIVKVFKGIL
ncbi:MAG TPA: DegT/DnrJ/EryC1/StrS family aminotransferase [Candidatus Nanoarchaeia archaeon]|nr:DegT/DnrJ/EryC1/StrS family aminotransferase [Candidatus Nanoarchaeia archaeon]